MLFFGALVFLAAWLLGTTQLYQLAYAFVGFFLVALVLGFVIFRGLRYTRRFFAGKRLAAGCPLKLELVISKVFWTWCSIEDGWGDLHEHRPDCGMWVD